MKKWCLTLVSPSSSPTACGSGSPTYNFPGKDNKTIQVILVGDISFKLTYPVKDSKEGKTDSLEVDVPSNTTLVQLHAVVTNDTHGGGTAPATMTWANDNGTYILTFHLSVTWSSNNQVWSLERITLDFSDFMPVDSNVTFGELGVNDTKVKTSLGRGFRCSTEEFPTLTSKVVNLTADLTIRNFQLQAFSFTQRGELDNQPSLCTRDMVDNKIVPIAVGAALGLLVIIVVIAYIIGRFRNRGKKSDYEVISS